MPDSDELTRHARACSYCDLRPLCLPSALDREEQAQLSARLSSHSYPEGAHVYNTGDPFRQMWLVRAGGLKTWATNLDGSLQILGFHFPGELVGLDGLELGRHQCTLEAMQDTTVCSIAYPELAALAREIPRLRHQLDRLISHEYVLEHEHIMMMSARPALERIALFLQSLSHRNELRGLDRDQLELAMPRSDIANFLAIANETVSRLFHRLQKQGVIEVDRRMIRILDHPRLIALGGEDLRRRPCAA